MVIVKLDCDTSSKMKCPLHAAAHFTLLSSILLAKQNSQITIESYFTEKEKPLSCRQGLSFLGVP